MLYALSSIMPNIWRFRNHSIAQNRLTRDIIEPFFEKYPDLSSRDRKRMLKYPLHFIVFFAEIWANMINIKLGSDDIRRLVFFGSSGCLYDDFFDIENLPKDELYEINKRPEYYKSKDLKKQLFIELNQEMQLLLGRMDNVLQRGFWDTFDKFWHAQVESKHQAGLRNLSKEEIWRISEQKGGYALLLSRYLMDSPLAVGEAEAIFKIGAWFQLLDDTLDLDKDLSEGVKTLLTTTSDINEINEMLRAETNGVIEIVMKFPFPEKAKKNASYRFFILSASGHVHLHQLKKLQESSGGIFKPHAYTKESMQWVENRWSNLFIAFPYLIWDFKIER